MVDTSFDIKTVIRQRETLPDHSESKEMRGTTLGVRVIEIGNGTLRFIFPDEDGADQQVLFAYREGNNGEYYQLPSEYALNDVNTRINYLNPEHLQLLPQVVYVKQGNSDIEFKLVSDGNVVEYIETDPLPSSDEEDNSPRLNQMGFDW